MVIRMVTNRAVPISRHNGRSKLRGPHSDEHRTREGDLQFHSRPRVRGHMQFKTEQRAFAQPDSIPARSHARVLVPVLFRYRNWAAWLREIPARFCEAHLADRFAEVGL